MRRIAQLLLCACANARQEAHTTALGYAYFARQLVDKRTAIVP